MCVLCVVCGEERKVGRMGGGGVDGAYGVQCLETGVGSIHTVLLSVRGRSLLVGAGSAGGGREWDVRAKTRVELLLVAVRSRA